MAFKANKAKVVPPRPAVVFDMYHPMLINILAQDPNGPIRVVLQLAKVAQSDPDGSYILDPEDIVSNVIPDLRPYMAENPALYILVQQIQSTVKGLAERLGWIPAASGVIPPSGDTIPPSGAAPAGEATISNPEAIIQPMMV
jgi:hypothetical protein